MVVSTLLQNELIKQYSKYSKQTFLAWPEVLGDLSSEKKEKQDRLDCLRSNVRSPNPQSNYGQSS